MKKSSSSSAVPDIKQTLEAVLLLAYRHVVAAEHTKALPLVEIARKLKISEGLAVKVASFLETEGLIDYVNQAVDVTIPGMLRAEALMRGEGGMVVAAGKREKSEKAPPAKAAPPAKRAAPARARR